MAYNRGFTLIEILVALAIFASVVTITSTIFVSALRAQRQSLAYQQLLDQTSYLMEYMSRAIRMAMKDDIEIRGFPSKNCLSGDKVNYEFINQCLKFRNYKNECQQFCLEETLEGKRRLKEIKDDGPPNYLTSSDLKVNSFNVTLTGETQNDTIQPLVSIFLNIEGKEQSKIQIQTSISQRNLDIQR